MSSAASATPPTPKPCTWQQLPEEIRKTVGLFRRGVADAVIDLSPYTTDALVSELLRLNVPLVMCGQPNPNTARCCCLAYVYSDDVAGGRLAGTHFQEIGATRIDALLGPENNPANTERLAGLIEIIGTPKYIGYGGWDEKTGYLLVQKATENASIDGIFCGNYRIVRGAIRYLQQQGRDVPGDIKVIGYDDHPPAANFDPPITTIQQDFCKQGAVAVRQAIKMINGERGKNRAHTQTSSTRLRRRENPRSSPLRQDNY